MLSKYKITIIILLAFTASACASKTDIFPDLPTSLTTSLTTSDLRFPNPTSIVADAANNQIILVNSNVDVFYDSGSIVLITVDAGNTNAPTLTASAIQVTPDFAGNTAFDGVSLYVPFREQSSSNSSQDQALKYTIGSGSISLDKTGLVDPDPFGIGLNGASVLVVSNNKLNLLNTDLDATATIDLTAASQAGIQKTSSGDVENIAVDTVNTKALITNRSGKIFIIDLANNTLSHVIDGPLNTRDAAFDNVNNLLYVTNGNPPALWIFDAAQLPADPAPDEVDDAIILSDVIDLDANPNGIAFDPTNNRAYIANTSDQSISVIDILLREEIDRISLKGADTGLDTCNDPFDLGVGIYNAVPFIIVACASSNNIMIINGNTLNVVAEYP